MVECSNSQEILFLLWNQKFHHHVHKNTLLVFVLSQINPFHTRQPCLHKIYLILSSEWSLPFRLFNLNFVCISCLSHVCLMPHPTYPPSFDHLNIWRAVKIMEVLITQFSLVFCHWSLLVPYILLSTMFPNTLSLHWGLLIWEPICLDPYSFKL